jgi:hypothetical protein
MTAGKFFIYAIGRLLVWVILVALWMRPTSAVAATEQTFDVLQIGTRVYTNVTVTTKGKDYIFILYAGGMTSIKLAQLSPELRQKLGYAERPAAGTNKTAVAWAKATAAKLEVPKFKEMSRQLGEKWQAERSTGKPIRFILILCGTLLVYLFHCFCFMLICRKSGYDPGIVVWLPVVQLFPLLRAAGMPAWWFVACLLPVLNIIPLALWCLKIAKARGKSPLTGFLLFLPVTSPFAFLYLAFSGGTAAAEPEDTEPEIMSLQSA